ncbi:MAG: glycosyltransferase family 4 protein [Granulosicoccus sp.]|nr:glycosyltransferase family 4 protein [Granulosicoccus sp.]
MTVNRIAFYAPLKPIDHPTPSGDRLMARLLVSCLINAGFDVDIASHLRAFIKRPDGLKEKNELEEQAEIEISRLQRLWDSSQAPDLWFSYHPYFKSPDLIGPRLCEIFDIPYVTAEASYSARRELGVWANTQRHVLRSLEMAAVNICFTRRDQEGIAQASSIARLVRLRPFIDVNHYETVKKQPECAHLVVVAMMRAGDKLTSYTHLARTLKTLQHIPWTLSIVGDGKQHQEVRACFAAVDEQRITWHGQLEHNQIVELFSHCSLYVWPGCGEAYGLAYLEAQAAGLPVVAFNTAGVAEVVCHQKTGILTPAGDETAYASAIAELLIDSNQLERLSRNAQEHVRREHSQQSAGAKLKSVIDSCSREAI